MGEIISAEHLPYKIDYLKSKKNKIVATNGCFDILHIGHIRSLQKAKTFGDILVIGINSNSSVKKIKGNDRPINSESERAEMLAALGCVDVVSIFSEESAEKFLEIVKPDIYVKGEEYNLDNLPEAKIVRQHGGKTIQIPMITGFSTTSIVERIEKLKKI